MEKYDLFIAYVVWENGGKQRPVLIYVAGGDIVSVFRITTKYESKSDAIKAKYFPITDWVQAGLDSPSYIDTSRFVDLDALSFVGKKPIGKLTEADKQRLIEFLTK